MVQQMFQAICDYIIQENDYFCKGYCDVVKDDTTNLIYTNTFPDRLVIFPNDQLGDYFYLRNNAIVEFNQATEFAISDCISGATQLIIPIVMVTVMRNVDPFILLQNISSSLSVYQETLLFNSSNWNREQIVAEELRGASTKEIEAAKNRLQNFTLLSFSFRLIIPFSYLKTNCITNPCKPC